MAGAQVAIEVTVTVDDAPLRALEQRLAAPSELSSRIGENMQVAIQDRFITQTTPGGVPWEKLNPRYLRRKKYNADKILTLRGYLRRSIRYQPGLSSPGTAVIGTNLRYAAIHQFGGTINLPARAGQARRPLFARNNTTRGAAPRAPVLKAHAITIPARPYLGVSDQERARLAGIVREWLAGKK